MASELPQPAAPSPPAPHGRSEASGQAELRAPSGGSSAESQGALGARAGLVSHCSEQYPRRCWNSALQKLRHSPRGGHSGCEAVCTLGAETCTAPGVSLLHPRHPPPAEEPRPRGKWTFPRVTCPPAHLSDGCQPVCVWNSLGSAFLFLPKGSAVLLQRPRRNPGTGLPLTP